MTGPRTRVARDALHGLRAARETDAAALDAALGAVRAARGDATADDEHDPEGSTLTSDWSRLEGLAAATRHELVAIDLALSRLADGTYGVCTACGADIGAGRLEVRPAAEHCIECARHAAR